MARDAIEVDVGDEYYTMSRPVDDSKRVADKDLTVELLQEADLKDCARILYESFPAWWWRQYEPEARQPPDETRHARLALRLAALLHHPDLVGVVARVEGNVAGFAGWSLPRAGATGPALKSLPDLPPTFMPNHFRKAVLDEIVPRAMGLIAAQWADVWAGTDVELWEAKFAGYDKDRLALTHARPHWFLAPIAVAERYRGRGVGGSLMKWACERADAGTLDSSATDKGGSLGEPQCMFLDAFPNARPVYMRYGFEGVPGSGESMMREARAKGESGS